MDSTVAIGFGSNLGSPQDNIDAAIELLISCGFKVDKISSLHITAPADCQAGTPDFTNGALTGHWSSSPQELLQCCQAIEQLLGRPKEHRSDEARVIDLDILLFGESKISTDKLIIPHPRMHHREFVLVPLAEIAGDWLIPDLDSVGNIYKRLRS